MEIVLYCPNTKNLEEIPVLDFLNERFNSIDASNGNAEEDLVDTLATWKYVKDNNGKTDGWYAKKEHGLDFIEIRIKKSKTLLRFPYYLDSINFQMVILLGYAKPDNYKPRGKEAKEVKRKQELAQEYYEDYHCNRNKAIRLSDKFEQLMNNN